MVATDPRPTIALTVAIMHIWTHMDTVSAMMATMVITVTRHTMQAITTITSMMR